MDSVRGKTRKCFRILTYFFVELQEGRSKGFDWHARVVDSIFALIVTITFMRVFIIVLAVKVLQFHHHNLLNNQSVYLDLRSMCMAMMLCLILKCGIFLLGMSLFAPRRGSFCLHEELEVELQVAVLLAHYGHCQVISLESSLLT